MYLKPELLSKLIVNGGSIFLKVLILTSLRIITGKYANVLPKPVASGLINILESSGTLENTSTRKEKGALPSKMMLVRFRQSLKAADLMFVMLSGILTLFRPKQSLKAKAPMLVTLLGIVTLVRLMHLMKA